MPADDQMKIDERRKYLRRMHMRYMHAGRGERSRLLDEMAQVTELHRKSLVRPMKTGSERKPRQRQRGRTYDHEVDDVIRVVAETLDYICADRLTRSLLPTVKLLIEHQELVVAEAMLEKLGRISVATIKRILKRVRQDERRLSRRGPERARQVLRQIPAERIPWDIAEAGHCEVDLVHHGGRVPAASTCIPCS